MLVIRHKPLSTCTHNTQASPRPVPTCPDKLEPVGEEEEEDREMAREDWGWADGEADESS